MTTSNFFVLLSFYCLLVAFITASTDHTHKKACDYELTNELYLLLSAFIFHPSLKKLKNNLFLNLKKSNRFNQLEFRNWHILNDSPFYYSQRTLKHGPKVDVNVNVTDLRCGFPKMKKIRINISKTLPLLSIWKKLFSLNESPVSLDR